MVLKVAWSADLSALQRLFWTRPSDIPLLFKWADAMAEKAKDALQRMHDIGWLLWDEEEGHFLESRQTPEFVRLPDGRLEGKFPLLQGRLQVTGDERLELQLDFNAMCDQQA